jgi:dihydrofolate reductase
MHTFLIASLSLDGKIARSDSQLSTDWTTKEDRHWFWRRTTQAGIMVMGSKTYQTIGRALPKRVTIVMTRHPEAWAAANQGRILSSDQPEAGFAYATDLSPNLLVERVESFGYPELAICGGSAIYTLFIKNNLVDTYYLTHEPVIFGKGVGLCEEEVNLPPLELVQSTPRSMGAVTNEYRVQR